MREFFYSIMTDKRGGAGYAPIKFLLYLVSLIYGLGLAARVVPCC